jgi:hypothetical protein
VYLSRSFADHFHNGKSRAFEEPAANRAFQTQPLAGSLNLCISDHVFLERLANRLSIEIPCIEYRVFRGKPCLASIFPLACGDRVMGRAAP